MLGSFLLGMGIERYAPDGAIPWWGDIIAGVSLLAITRFSKDRSDG
jgi:hypothetical protein